MPHSITPAILLITLAAGFASAQDLIETRGLRLNQIRGGVPNGLILGRYSTAILLSDAAIREEIKLTDAQESRWSTARKQYDGDFDQLRKEVAERRKKAQDAKDVEEVDRIDEEERSAKNDLREKLDEFVDRKILDRGQARRLSQIRYQAEGVEAFTRPEIQESLGLDQEQIEEIKRIRFESARKFSNVGRLPQGVRPPKPGEQSTPETRKKYDLAVQTARGEYTEVRTAAMTAVAGIFNKAQLTKYRNLVGKPFDFLHLNKKDAQAQAGEGPGGAGTKEATPTP